MKRPVIYGLIILVFGMFIGGITQGPVNLIKGTVGSVFQGKAKVEDPEEVPVVPVRVAEARVGSMSSSIEVSGDIKALKSATLSAKIPGRVTAVPYREGDRVRAGAVVVRQDTSDQSAQAKQAEAALQAAKARLSQAVTSEGISDTQTEAQIAQAQAALDTARAHLRMIRSGARTQERAQAENAVASAKANFENAKVNHQRMSGLYSEGAIPKQQMDMVQMQYDVASAQLDSARQQLSLVEAGARPEEIEAAEKQVAQAEESLRMAKANREQMSLRKEDAKSARAGVAQAEAALTFARQQVSNASISTPFPGTIAKRMTEPGQMANPGVPLIEIVALDTVYFEANVSEMDVHRVAAGQPVEVSVDALPGRKYRGSVLKILPTADSRSRKFPVHITVHNPTGDLKPGMFARGQIELARSEDAVILPKDSLISRDDGLSSVYLVIDSTAILTPVMTGFENRTEIEAITGVRPGDMVVISGQDNLSEGARVNVVN